MTDQSNLVPGVMHCAKCGFDLLRQTLYAASGTIGAGTSETEPCPNGCGPLWPVTWEQEARKGWAFMEKQGMELSALRTSQNPDQKEVEARIRELIDAAESANNMHRKFLHENGKFLTHVEGIMRRLVVELQKAGHGYVNSLAWHKTEECDGCKVVKDALDTLK